MRSLALLSGRDPALLWLWRRPAGVALIGPLVWEPPCATGAALNRPKKKKKARIKVQGVPVVAQWLTNP